MPQDLCCCSILTCWKEFELHCLSRDFPMLLNIKSRVTIVATVDVVDNVESSNDTVKYRFCPVLAGLDAVRARHAVPVGPGRKRHTSSSLDGFKSLRLSSSILPRLCTLLLLHPHPIFHSLLLSQLVSRPSKKTYLSIWVSHSASAYQPAASPPSPPSLLTMTGSHFVLPQCMSYGR